MSTKTKTFYTTILEKTQLNQEKSHKCTFHISLDLSDIDLNYRPGDCIGVHPINHRDLVNKTLDSMRLSGDIQVEHKKHGILSFNDLLKSKSNITKITKPILKAIVKKQDNSKKRESLETILAPENRALFLKLSDEVELWDLLKEHHEVSLPVEEWVRILPPLTPRLYSICSSQSVYKDEVHLLIALTKYESLGQKRYGACSNYLFNADRQNQIQIHYHKTPDFLLPEDLDAPIIMVGPGTGVAPFRAFMQERSHANPNALSWLFFGECHKESDYYYQDEWKDLASKGSFEISTAFSRDQENKIYVQDRIYEQGQKVYSWLEKGAYIYICGDADHMAPAVEEAFLKIIQEQRNVSYEDALQYLDSLKKEKRYLKDVY